MNQRTNKRLWTQIAEDIGFVLRKDIIDKRRLNTCSEQRKLSTNKLIRTLINTNPTIQPLPATPTKKIFVSAATPPKVGGSNLKKGLSVQLIQY
jgi:hypothetical protein